MCPKEAPVPTPFNVLLIKTPSFSSESSCTAISSFPMADPNVLPLFCYTYLAASILGSEILLQLL
jgi:hypothetical protein